MGRGLEVGGIICDDTRRPGAGEGGDGLGGWDGGVGG